MLLLQSLLAVLCILIAALPQFIAVAIETRRQASKA